MKGKEMTEHIHICIGEAALDSTFSSIRIQISSLVLFPVVHSHISKYPLAIIHWMTWSHFNAKTKLINM